VRMVAHAVLQRERDGGKRENRRGNQAEPEGDEEAVHGCCRVGREPRPHPSCGGYFGANGRSGGSTHPPVGTGRSSERTGTSITAGRFAASAAARAPSRSPGPVTRYPSAPIAWASAAKSALTGSPVRCFRKRVASSRGPNAPTWRS